MERNNYSTLKNILSSNEKEKMLGKAHSSMRKITKQNKSCQLLMPKIKTRVISVNI